MSVSKEAIEVAALAVRYVWTQWGDGQPMVLALERGVAISAITAAMPHLLAAKDAEIAALRPAVYVQPMRLSSGDVDYYVALQVGNRRTTPFMFRNTEWKAAYEADHLRWVLLGGEEPDLMAYSPEGFPARAALEMSGGANPPPAPK